jgi:hypothetical protein
VKTIENFSHPIRSRLTPHAGPTCQVTWWPKRWNDHRNRNLGSVSVKNELLFSPTPHLPTLCTRWAHQVRIGKKTSPPAREPLLRGPAGVFPKISDFSRLLGAFVSLSQNRRGCLFLGEYGFGCFILGSPVLFTGSVIRYARECRFVFVIDVQRVGIIGEHSGDRAPVHHHVHVIIWCNKQLMLICFQLLFPRSRLL